MQRKTIVALVSAALLVVGGAAAATAMGADGETTASSPDAAMSGVENVDATASLENGTVLVTVTDEDGGVSNVTVTYDEETAHTFANGTASFDASPDEEVEIELEKGHFEGELEYVVDDGSLTLVEEEYEYHEVDEEAEEDEEDEAEDEEDEAETEEEEAEDDEAEEDGEDEQEAEDERSD